MTARSLPNVPNFRRALRVIQSSWSQLTAAFNVEAHLRVCASYQPHIKIKENLMHPQSYTFLDVEIETQRRQSALSKHVSAVQFHTNVIELKF